MFGIKCQYMPNAVAEEKGLGHDFMSKGSASVSRRYGKRPFGINCQYMPTVAVGVPSHDK